MFAWASPTAMFFRPLSTTTPRFIQPPLALPSSLQLLQQHQHCNMTSNTGGGWQQGFSRFVKSVQTTVAEAQENQRKAKEAKEIGKIWEYVAILYGSGAF